eukprot:6459834-Amphidinium_carterae.2
MPKCINFPSQIAYANQIASHCASRKPPSCLAQQQRTTTGACQAPFMRAIASSLKLQCGVDFAPMASSEQPQGCPLPGHRATHTSCHQQLQIVIFKSSAVRHTYARYPALGGTIDLTCSQQFVQVTQII